ncbi:carboxylesterase family protein [Algoriphagus halophytocola]|uniref:Carboxylic ester hydrolase n=1 Tax=Algoriphagus halophytocola TaxID=2991499 RepID=A0ABY6MCL8_9BACT|nr:MULTISPECIES: carboxylesterase family protein [unclassified Algoriphagus]UZD21437.1 carboxylesterase family protein [Algoriphagus sp. TR-M5]WBL42649.1 carboxylesterase family protein [Algoriphagus sp. TR-M9]
MKNQRREFFKKVGVGTAGLGLAATVPLSAQGHANPSKQSNRQFLQIGDDIAIANTDSGKIRGYILNDVYTFLGVPYGADTSGKNRFMPPKKPEKWDGVKPAIWWGNTAPQIMDNRYANVDYSFADHWNYDDVSEDCLKLNVWTPALDSKKRPVLVWLHGGGFTNGNGIEQDGYHGENISKNGDIVFVSINHRLGPIGFTDLSGVGGAKYAHSGNVGQLDIVASLEWVRENIANFGGDPNNVTIMGQSGGGAKVTATMSMPAAKGLVHRAVPLSGSMIQATPQEYSQKLGEYVLKEAGLSRDQIDKLQELSWREYIDIANRAQEKMRNDHPNAGFRGGFSPVADGVNLPKGEFFADPNGQTAAIPMLVCTTFHEWNPTRTSPELEKIDWAGVVEQLHPRFGEASEKIVNAYRQDFPEASPADIWAMVLSNRQGAINTANAKAKQKAPVYLAWFGWEPQLYSGRMKAFHCIDICFWFDNTDRMYTHTGGGDRPRKLSQKMSASLLAFMKTGNPNAGALPQWKAYTPSGGETMILNDTSVLKNKPDANGLAALQA